MNRTMDAYDHGYRHGQEVAFGRETTTGRRMSDVFWAGYGHGLEAGQHRQGFQWSEKTQAWLTLAEWRRVCGMEG